MFEMKQEFFDNLREKIQIYFEDGAGHAFDHTQRVYNLALNLSEGEGVDLDILKAATLLHDIARHKEDKGEIECHAIGSSEMAKEILIKTNFPKDKIKNVVHAIFVHRFSRGLKAETKEAKVLQDADRLDALGAITIARIFMFNGKKGNPLYGPEKEPNREYRGQESTAINHFYEKILKIKPEIFYTKKAREIAKGRYNFVKEYLKQFKDEWEGKK